MKTTIPITITIPGNPGLGGINKAKMAKIVKGHPRLAPTKHAEAFEKKAVPAVKAAKFEQQAAALAIAWAPAVRVVITEYWPTQRKLDRAPPNSLGRGDVDGPLKLTIDSLQKAGLIDDDARVVELVARKFVDRLNPRIEIMVEPFDVIGPN